MNLHLSVIERGSVSVIKATGRLSLAETPGRLRTTALELVAKNSKEIVIDLTGVTYIDSTGLSILVTTWDEVRSAGGKLVVVKNSKVNELFQTTHIDHLFTTFNSLEDAVSSFTS